MGMKVSTVVKSAMEISHMLDELKKHNLRNDVDFTFAYFPQTVNDKWEITQEKCVVFDFVDEKNATWFSLLN